MRARSTLFTLFGDIVRPAGGEAWLTTLTGCMQAMGFTPEATRTALHRMAAEDWVEPRKSGRYAAYRLTPKGVDRLEEAAARIYRLRAVEWDGRWRLLVAPGVNRLPTLAKALGWMGFGRLSPDAWVSPHSHGDRLVAVLASHDLSDVPRFVSEPGANRDRDQRIVRTAWDLDELRAAHADFLDTWPDDRPPADPSEAFVTRVRLVHHWRSFLFLDPGLPVALLPDDWLGDAAALRFRTLYEALQPAAWSFYESLAAAAPANGDEASAGPVRRSADSPFAKGLRALDTDRPPASDQPPVPAGRLAP